jgi:hypothetical protein
MVIFRSPEGKPGYHQSEGLDDAMRFAEMLRNQEQVTDARIFRMDEVPIEFKTYYRVEVAAAAEEPVAASAAEPVAASAAEPAEPAEGRSEDGVDDRVEQPADDPADGAGNEESESEPIAGEAKARHGLFSRS